MGLFSFKKEKAGNCIEYAEKFDSLIWEDTSESRKKAKKLLKSWKSDYPKDPNLYYCMVVLEMESAKDKRFPNIIILKKKTEKYYTYAVELEAKASQLLPKYGLEVETYYFNTHRKCKKSADMALDTMYLYYAKYKEFKKR